MSILAVSRIRQLDTHRLIRSKYSENDDSVLVRLADDNDHLRDVFALDQASNNRLLAENGLLPGIGIDELVSGVPCRRIINAAFSYAHPLGSRFNGPDRGAWYAGFVLKTAQAEAAWHKSVELAEIDRFEESVTYDDYLADFGGEYHDIREDVPHRNCLDPDNYIRSQLLAETLLAKCSPGIIYPSVRHNGGVCLTCFRPALAGNVRKSARYRFTWAGSPEPAIEFEKSYM